MNWFLFEQHLKRNLDVPKKTKTCLDYWLSTSQIGLSTAPCRQASVPAENLNFGSSLLIVIDRPCWQPFVYSRLAYWLPHKFLDLFFSSSSFSPILIGSSLIIISWKQCNILTISTLTRFSNHRKNLGNLKLYMDSFLDYNRTVKSLFLPLPRTFGLFSAMPWAISGFPTLSLSCNTLTHFMSRRNLSWRSTL